MVRKRIRTVLRTVSKRPVAIVFTRPPHITNTGTKRLLTFDTLQSTRRILQQVGESIALDAVPAALDAYSAAVELAASRHIDALTVLDALRHAYAGDDVPEDDLPALLEQIDEQISRYEVRDEPVEVALALVRLEGFERRETDGRTVYTAQIAYPVDKERYLLSWDAYRDKNRKDLGFHYTPLEFDSKPEMHFFEQLLAELNIQPWEVEDVYFTGGLTDPGKTDFFVEYKDQKGKWRRYIPDFVIRKKPGPGMPDGSGRICIVEIKAERDRPDPVNGEHGAKAMALQRWTELNPERLKYEMIFTRTDAVEYDMMRPVWKFCEQRELYLSIALDRDRIAEFCQKWRIAELSLFGSVLRPWEFRPDSDVDVLVRYHPAARWSLFDEVEMEDELRDIVGRDVDFVSRSAVEQSDNWIRRQAILESAVPFYVA